MKKLIINKLQDWWVNLCEAEQDLILKIIKQNYVTNIKEKNDTGKIRCVIKYYVLMI